jgi:PRTRC genetic system protein B
MTDITCHFSNPFFPVAQLVVYRAEKNAAESDEEYYVELFDINKAGFAVNGHPLTVKESARLAESLNCNTDLNTSFLQPEGILADNVLYLNPNFGGYAIWYTPPRQVELFFKESLKIPSGRTWVPALLWKATKDNVWVYALSGKGRPTAKTKLCHAPFFNIYQNGKVCMGNVKVRIPPQSSLESFMGQWQDYFFNSYFSHMIETDSPVKGNIVQAWQQLMASGLKFPAQILKKNGLTLKTLIR